MNTQIINIVVTDIEKSRLDVYLAEQVMPTQLQKISRSQIKHLVQAGCISIDGEVVKKSGYVIQSGMKIEVTLQESSNQFAVYDLKLDIIFEDRDLLVVNKPANLSMHPGAGNKNKTLLNACLPYLNDKVDSFQAGTRPGIVHRLDKDTTGLVVVARTASSHAELSKQFAARSIERTYQVLVTTTPRARRLVQRENSGVIETNLARDPKGRQKQCVVDQGGKKAVTHWTCLEHFKYGALLNIKLDTGRTHQIRVHMLHIGSPVVGDKIYHGQELLPFELKQAAQLFGRQALHACVLGFDHPRTGERLRFESNPPQDMFELIEKFRSA